MFVVGAGGQVGQQALGVQLRPHIAKYLVALVDGATERDLLRSGNAALLQKHGTPPPIFSTWALRGPMSLTHSTYDGWSAPAPGVTTGPLTDFLLLWKNGDDGPTYEYGCGTYDGTYGVGITLRHSDISFRWGAYDQGVIGSLIDSGESLPIGFNFLVYVRDGTYHALYRNGRRVATYIGGGMGNASATSRWGHGNIGVNIAPGFSASSKVVALSGRFATALTHEQIVALSANPRNFLFDDAVADAWIGDATPVVEPLAPMVVKDVRHLRKPEYLAPIDDRFRSKACGLWYVAGHNQIVEATGQQPKYGVEWDSARNITSLAYMGESRQQGWGFGGGAASATNWTGAIAVPYAQPLLDGATTEFTMVAVFWRVSIASRYNVIMRMDASDGRYLFSLDTPDANKVRALVSTSGTTGWTTAVDVNYTIDQQKAYVVVARWYNGGTLQVWIRPTDGSAPATMLVSAHTPTGALIGAGSGSDANLQIHIAGLHGYSGTDTFGGLVFGAGYTAKALRDPYIAEILNNPWSALLAPIQLAHTTVAPAAAVSATANGVTISGAASVIAGTTMVAATATGALLTVDASIITGTAVSSPTRVWPMSDIADGGWKASSGVDLSAMVSEETPSDAEFVWRPLSSSGTFTFGTNITIPVGTHTLKMRPRVTAGTGQIRLVLLDASNNVVGTGSWQSAATAYATLTSTIIVTSPATQGRIEAQA